MHISLFQDSEETIHSAEKMLPHMKAKVVFIRKKIEKKKRKKKFEKKIKNWHIKKKLIFHVGFVPSFLF